MKYVVLTMMIVFGLAGPGLLLVALSDFLRHLWCYPRLERAEGIVIGVKTRIVPTHTRSKLSSGRTHNPIIQFVKSDGSSESFESTTGDAGITSRFKIGQAICVRYDPFGTLAPMIDTIFGIWGSSALMGFSGFLFSGASYVIFVLFGDRIFPL